MRTIRGRKVRGRAWGRGRRCRAYIERQGLGDAGQRRAAFKLADEGKGRGPGKSRQRLSMCSKGTILDCCCHGSSSASCIQGRATCHSHGRRAGCNEQYRIKLLVRHRMFVLSICGLARAHLADPGHDVPCAIDLFHLHHQEDRYHETNYASPCITVDSVVGKEGVHVRSVSQKNLQTSHGHMESDKLV